MKAIKLAHKFFLLGIAVTVLFGVPSWLFVTELNDRIAFAELEADGAQYLPAVLELLKVTQQHRGMFAMVLNGRTDLADELQQKRAEVDEANRVFVATTEQYAHLGLTDNAGRLSEQWKALRADMSGLSATDNFTRHTTLVEAILTFVVDVADAESGFVRF